MRFEIELNFRIIRGCIRYTEYVTRMLKKNSSYNLQVVIAEIQYFYCYFAFLSFFLVKLNIRKSHSVHVDDIQDFSKEF